MRIGEIKRARIIQAAHLGNVPMLAYSMKVNAKNGYGGYTGEKLFMCLTGVKDERTVLRVKAVGE